MSRTTDFIDLIKGQAVKDMHEKGILASLTVAQAILESGWGESFLSKKYNNLFGIKSVSWNDNRVSLPTDEYYDGKRTTIMDYFRVYNNLSESIADHTRLLLTARYKRVIGETDYKTACKMIYECGYATDINYPTKLISIIESNKLYELDVEYKINKVVDNVDIKIIQTWLNLNGFRDADGNVLDVDGIEGTKTKFAKNNAKIMINYILK